MTARDPACGDTAPLNSSTTDDAPADPLEQFQERHAALARQAESLFGYSVDWSGHVPLPASLERTTVSDWLVMLRDDFRQSRGVEQAFGLRGYAHDDELDGSLDPLVLVEDDIAAVVVAIGLPWDDSRCAKSGFDIANKLTAFLEKYGEKLRAVSTTEPSSDRDAQAAELDRLHPHDDVPTLLVLLQRALVQPWWWKVNEEQWAEFHRYRDMGNEEAASAYRFEQSGDPKTASACRERAKEFHRTSESCHALRLHAYSRTVIRAEQIVRNELPELLGDFPALDLTVERETPPAELAQRFKRLQGKVLEWVKENALPDAAATPTPPAEPPAKDSVRPMKQKKSFAKGEAEEKLKGELLRHHEYNNDGSIANWNPIGVNDLSRKAGLGKKSGSASEFFTKWFGQNSEHVTGHQFYRGCCENRSRRGTLVAKLALMSGKPLKERLEADRRRDEDD